MKFRLNWVYRLENFDGGRPEFRDYQKSIEFDIEALAKAQEYARKKKEELQRNLDCRNFSLVQVVVEEVVEPLQIP